jgi:predicted Zn finger-like uncharacterized protein
MDVRCDRCETEYELDDDSVAEGGASVQCTTCGHTFVVGPDGETIAQIVPTSPAGLDDLVGPQAADWLLATEDGQTHRFRDLTTLQKWVVERKATREDRVSQRGDPWRPLGDVDELAPFFDVVEQADRARTAQTSGRRSPAPRDSEGLSTRATSMRPTTVARPDSSWRPRVNGFGGGGSLSARLDSGPVPTLETDMLEGEDPEKFETMAIRNQRGLKIAGVAGFVGMAVVAAGIGFSRPHWLPFFKNPEPARTEVGSGAGSGAASPMAAGPPGTRSTATAATAAAPSAGGAPAPVAPLIDPIPSTRVPSPPMPQAIAPRSATAPPERAQDQAPPARAKSYERLVGEADHLMENGQPVRAQKLLDEALAMQPNGVAALSGSAYLLLDRQKPLAAISMFKRALNISPEFPPALFGLAEAFRAQGELPAAADNYRKYIGVAPGGPDAPAARRQLKEIESLAPRRAPAETPAPTTPAKESAKESSKSDPAPPAAE